MSQDLTTFFTTVQTIGKLRTQEHAQRWTRAVLQTLGLNISSAAKKGLKKSLPKELADSVSDVFWLFNFRDTTMTATYFQERVGRRAGNTDPVFAKHPTLAVFAAVQQLVGNDVAQSVADSLSPEVSQLWNSAPQLVANQQ